MNFLCIYLGEGMGTLMHVYVWEQKVVFPTEPLDGYKFTKLGRDEVLIVPYKCCCFSA